MTIKRCYSVLVGASVVENQLVQSGATSVTVQNGHKYYAKINGAESLGASTGSAITTNDSSKDMVIDLSLLLPSSIVDYVYSLGSSNGIAKLREWGFLRGYQAHNAGSIESVEVTGKKVVGFNQWDEVAETGTYNLDTGTPISTSSYFRTKNPIKALPNTTYHIASGGDAVYVFFYGADDNYLGYRTFSGQSNIDFTTAINCYYIRFVDVTRNVYDPSVKPICINLSNPDRNGEYEPYTSTTYSLGSDVLRGIFKLDANNNLYADGDVKTSDGVITRKYKKVTYDGSEAWEKDRDVNGYNRYYIADNSVKVLSDYRDNIVNSKGYSIASTYAFANTGLGDITMSAYSIAGSSDWVYFGLKTSLNISTVADFKTWLSNNPVTVILPLATPTTETSTPFTSPQVCYPDGTEEFVTETGVPVGHVSKYQL